MGKKSKNLSENTLQLLNIGSFDELGIQTLDTQQLIYLEVQPLNVAVSGNDRVLESIRNLQSVLENTTNLQVLCLSSSQSYEKNKQYLRERSEDESMDPNVRQLCYDDIEYLDELSLSMSTGRSFYFILPFHQGDLNQIRQQLAQSEAIIREQGFQIRHADKRDLQKALAIYWEQNTHLDQYPELDGEQFLMEANTW